MLPGMLSHQSWLFKYCPLQKTLIFSHFVSFFYCKIAVISDIFLKVCFGLFFFMDEKPIELPKGVRRLPLKFMTENRAYSGHGWAGTYSLVSSMLLVSSSTEGNASVIKILRTSGRG